MGFWNGKADGPLDKMFDFNRDGKLNAWERAMELGLLMDDEDDYQDEDDEFDDDDDEEDDESEELMEEDWDSDYDESDEW
ncbi:hypothetical protein [Eubacterium sp. AF17-7]|uniref:hypothetical protein n=1 Tax=Eubacterium sp. AF17-7 TaxID=2293105 RepID=UPI001314BF04|nr:hypothetical protein [Eubacterium sp. AF17-7]